jgi:TolB-like protein
MSPILNEVALLFKTILLNTKIAPREIGMTEYNASVISPRHSLSRVGSPTPSDNDVAIQIDRILASRWFSRSERLCRFIRFSANHVLSRGADRLKEYLVGVEVFDRGPAYDPRIDPIVRVEARRLRAKLKAYYASAGRDDQLRIEFPKGSYSPIFRLRPSQQIKWKPAVNAAISVSPFMNFTNSTSNESFCEGLTEELIHQLAQNPGLKVVVDHRASQRPDDGKNLRLPAGVTKWNLRGSIRGAPKEFRIIVQLIETASGAYIWSETYEPTIGDILSVQEDIAKAVVARFRLTLELPRIATKAG